MKSGLDAMPHFYLDDLLIAKENSTVAFQIEHINIDT